MKKTITAIITSAILASCSGMQSPTGTGTGIALFTGKAKVTYYKTDKLTSACYAKMKATLKERLAMNPEPAFGMVYMPYGPNSNCDVRWALSGNSLEKTSKATKDLCEAVTESPCVLTAEIVPSNYKPTKHETIKTRYADEIIAYAEGVGYGAVVISDYGISYAVTGRASLREAKDDVWSACNNSNFGNYPEEIRKPLNKKYPCRIAHTKTPEGFSGPIYIDGVQIK